MKHESYAETERLSGISISFNEFSSIFTIFSFSIWFYDALELKMRKNASQFSSNLLFEFIVLRCLPSPAAPKQLSLENALLFVIFKPIDLIYQMNIIGVKTVYTAYSSYSAYAPKSFEHRFQMTCSKVEFIFIWNLKLLWW